MSLKSENEAEAARITRQRLQDRFDTECPYSFKSTKEKKSCNQNLERCGTFNKKPHCSVSCGFLAMVDSNGKITKRNK